MSKQKQTITEFRSYQLPIEFPVLLLTGNQWRISDRPSENLHFHNCLEIGFCHEGSGVLVVQNKKLTFSAGDITCIARNIPHTTYSDPGTASKWSYLFTDPQELLEHFTPGITTQLSELYKTLSAANIVPASCAQNAAFYFEAISKGIQEKKGHYQIKAKADFLALFFALSEQFPHVDAPRDNNVISAFNILPALEFIKKNYMNSFSMDTLADLCGLSPTHFRRIFNLAMGSSPLEYLNSVRINKACYLLRSTDNSILSISEDVGFHSISSFNRYFDRMVGMSPREYRHAEIHDDRIQRAKIMKYNGWLEPDI